MPLSRSDLDAAKRQDERPTSQLQPDQLPSQAGPTGASSSLLKSVLKLSFRFFAAFAGVALLAILVLRAGPRTVWNQVHAVGAGMGLIIMLAGIGYFVRTWAWRLTFLCDISRLSWSRSFACCLVSEAFGQLGVGGKVFGEGIRISLLRAAVPLSNAIPSGAIDGGLHVASSTIMMISGIIATLLLAPVNGIWRRFALIVAIGLLGLLILVAISVGKRWELMEWAAKAIARIHRFRDWITRREPVIHASEQNLLSFCREAPRAFFAAFMLNFLWQAFAVIEVYMILRFMGARIALPGAFILEGLTKLINAVGLFNPGNVGTYEGGNMLITNLFGISGAAGLTLALCRRARSLFWALIGAVCLILMSKPKGRRDEDKGTDMNCGLANT